MRVLGAVIAIIGSLLLFCGTQQQVADPVKQAFDQYEAMWRVAAVKAAEALEDGKLTTDQQTHKYLSEANQAARKQAFSKIAKSEQELLGDGWTPENHAQILRGYAK